MPAGESSDWRDILSRNLHASKWPSEFESIVNKLSNGEKLSRSDGHFLFNSKDLDTIGRIANIVKYARFDNSAFFNVNVHINQTNIMTNQSALSRVVVDNNSPISNEVNGTVHIDPWTAINSKDIEKNIAK